MTIAHNTTPKYQKPSEFGRHILHLNKIGTTELARFVEDWLAGPSYITEKVDGLFFNFGVDDQGFYVGSRYTRKHSLNEINARVYYMEPWRKAFAALQNIDFQATLGYENTFHVECEYLPTNDYNVVQYSPDIIKDDGLFVVYTITIDGNQVYRTSHEDEQGPSPHIIQLQKAVSLSGMDTVVFTSNPVVKSEDIGISRKAVDDFLTNMITIKVEKNMVKYLLTEVHLRNYKSKFGGTGSHSFVEGFVFHSPNMKLKVVTPSFERYKTANWFITEQADAIVSSFKRGLKDRYKILDSVDTFNYKAHQRSLISDIKMAKVQLIQEATLKENNATHKSVLVGTSSTFNLPKKQQDGIKYRDLLIERLCILETFTTTAEDFEGMKVAIDLYCTNKLEV